MRPRSSWTVKLSRFGPTPTSALARVGRKAVELGERFCPGGYRLLSNFGRDGLQSQEHGHVHVIGGVYLGPYA